MSKASDAKEAREEAKEAREEEAKQALADAPADSPTGNAGTDDVIGKVTLTFEGALGEETQTFEYKGGDASNTLVQVEQFVRARRIAS